MFDQKLEEDNTMQGDLDFRNRIISDYMGKLVHIVVDRPIGYRHGDIIYPINYGYIPGLIAGDGEEQDAYILGIDKPLTDFTGTVIAVIHRSNDVEDKWVVAPNGMSFTKEEILRAVDFQEKYFEIEIEMLE
jgi:inorganic pyrophosphatase